MLTILLTSYNRPYLLKRALDSLVNRTCPDWKCLLLDDNSNEETIDVIKSYKDEKRIIPVYHSTTDEERKQKSRYAVLINEQLPKLKKGIVGYLCDNVEYEVNLVFSVLRYFERSKDSFSCFVPQHRDIWIVSENKSIGSASQFGHWDILPMPDMWRSLSGDIKGYLDHSQVFHRLPVSLQWSENIETVKFGDADFYTRLNEKYGPINFCVPSTNTMEHIPA